ncbi:MAG TPA: hypothetical protein VFG59_06160 [Anaeromyxobacter sp.]|nr:hypothetical protein [Anaeromyxobacter sp.]
MGPLSLLEPVSLVPWPDGPLAPVSPVPPEPADPPIEPAEPADPVVSLPEPVEFEPAPVFESVEPLVPPPPEFIPLPAAPVLPLELALDPEADGLLLVVVLPR